MAYTFTKSYGGGVVMAPAWVMFLTEVVECEDLLPGLINSGQLGNPAHAAQGTDSDHNPFVTSPITGLRYIRAADFSGPRSSWYKLLEFWNYLYKIHHPFVYPFGYTNSDVQDNRHGLTIWYGDGTTRNGSDGPHAHLSSSRANTYSIGVGAWNAAMEKQDRLGLRAYLTGRADEVGKSPVAEESLKLYKEDDVPVLVSADYRGYGILAGDSLTYLVDAASIQGAVAAGFPQWKISPQEWDNIRGNGSGAGTIFHGPNGFAVQSNGSPTPHPVGDMKDINAYRNAGYVEATVSQEEWTAAGIPG